MALYLGVLKVAKKTRHTAQYKIIHRVAKLTGLELEDCDTIIKCLYRAMAQELAYSHKLQLPGIGKFELYHAKHRTRMRCDVDKFLRDVIQNQETGESIETLFEQLTT